MASRQMLWSPSLAPRLHPCVSGLSVSSTGRTASCLPAPQWIADQHCGSRMLKCKLLGPTAVYCFKWGNQNMMCLLHITAMLSEQSTPVEAGSAYLFSASHTALEWSLRAAQCPAVCAAPLFGCTQLRWPCTTAAPHSMMSQQPASVLPPGLAVLQDGSSLLVVTLQQTLSSSAFAQMLDKDNAHVKA